MLILWASPVATAPSSCCLCSRASPQTASAHIYHLGNSVMQVVPGFPRLQQVATDASAFDSWVPSHLFNACSVCIVPLPVLGGLWCMLGAWVVPFVNAPYHLCRKTHTTEQKKAELRQDRQTLVPQIHTDLALLSYTGSNTLLGSYRLHHNTHCQEKP